MQIDSTLVEQLAQQAIYSTDNHVKQQAESQFEQLLFRISLESMDFNHLLEQHSETVVLATAAKLAQSVTRIDNLGPYLQKVNSIFRSWFNSREGLFVRENGQPLQKYVVNTIGLFLGRSLKQLFQVKGNESSVMDWLKRPQQGDKYRLYLFLTFIENVSLIDGSLNFVTYKILLQSFQEEIIPIMFDCLYPYFINFSEDIEVAGLSHMQGRLNIREASGISKGQDEYKTFNHFTFSIFQLLSQIVNFKYNLNFKQFNENEDTKGTISFPESVIKQIIKKDFLEALYSIISRLLQLPAAENYFNLCLECLSKVLSVKICFIPENVLSKFIGINLKGIVQIFDLMLQKKRGNEKTLSKVVDCCNIFLDIFGVCHLQDLQKLDSKYEDYFQRLVQRVYTLPLLIMTSGSALNADNILFSGSVQMMKTFGVDLTFLKIQNLLPFVQHSYQEFTKLFFVTFFTSSTNILGEVTFSNLEEFKKTVLNFFEGIVMICSSNYQMVFELLNELLPKLYENLQQNQINIGNIFLFLAATFDSEFYEVNINNQYLFDEKEGRYQFQPAVKALLQNLVAIFTFVETYETTHDYFSSHINKALTIFYSEMLTKFVQSTVLKDRQDQKSMSNELEIKEKVFIFMKKHLNSNDDSFILRGLLTLSKLMKKAEITCIQFIFECLHKLISVIKHKFIRNQFKNTAIYRQMLSLFNGLVGEKLNPEVMRWRVMLFKSLSLLCFDETLDDYRGNIRNAIALIKGSNQNQLDRVLYDLIGICDGIESTIIFDYFLTKLTSEINYQDLIIKLFRILGGREVFLKDILHLSYLMIQSKDGDQPISKLYDIVEGSLPFWNHVLQKIGRDQDNTQLFEEIYLIEKTIIAGGHINLAVVDEKVPNQLRNFIYLTLSHCMYFLEHVENYPHLIKPFFDFIHLLFIKLKKLLYNHEESGMALKLTEFLYTMMGRIVNQFENIINQSYNQTIFQMTLNTLNSFFTYLKDSREVIHRKMHNEHQPAITELNPDKERFIMHIFMLGLHFGGREQLQTVEVLASIALNLSLLYSFKGEEMAQQIGISEEKDKKQFIRIVTYIKQGQEAEWILYQLKDWFKSQNRFTENLPSIQDGY